MKTSITFLFLILFTSLILETAAQVIYVNHASKGDHSGSDWTNAYPDLKDALAAAQQGDTIWVAQSTYTPNKANGSSLASFQITKNLVLLGGFNGTESAAFQRNSELYKTILSGDLKGNDLEDDFVNNRFDNVMTVVVISSNITNETVIDGFTIRNGHADKFSSTAYKSGGGLYSLGHPVIKQCRFTQNFAIQNGGAVYLQGRSARGTIFENCSFEKNQITSSIGNSDSCGGGALAVINVSGDGVSIFDSSFESNEASAGGAVYFYDSNGLFDGVTFSDNVALRQGGGLRFYHEISTIPIPSLTIKNCSFQNNSASYGGGVYCLLAAKNAVVDIKNSSFSENYTATEIPGLSSGGSGLCFTLIRTAANTDFSMTHCTFENNITEGAGGGAGFHIGGSSNHNRLMIDDCVFSNNTADLTGSALVTLLGSQDIDLEINKSQFLNNTCNGEGSVNIWGTARATGTALIDSCLFDGNDSFRSGALEMGNGLHGGADLDYSITNSTFKNNQANEGGAMRLWSGENSQTDILVDKCTLDSNSGSIRGGAIGIYIFGNSFNPKISRTTITNNESPRGGAIDAHIYNPKTIFPKDVNILIENSLIAYNTSNGAAITLDSIEKFNLLNCTVANNQSDGIHLSDRSGLVLQNTILYNPGYTEYDALTNDVTLASIGGNLIGDSSFGTVIHPNDKEGLDPKFISSKDFHLQANSPAIDKGVYSENLPLYDIDGNDRIVNCVDIGAYESEYEVSKQCLTGNNEIFINESLNLFPNPAAEYLNIRFPETITQPLELGLFDTQGRFVRQLLIENNQRIDILDLQVGMYLLKAMDNGKIYSGKFVKQ